MKYVISGATLLAFTFIAGYTTGHYVAAKSQPIEPPAPLMVATESEATLAAFIATLLPVQQNYTAQNYNPEPSATASEDTDTSFIPEQPLSSRADTETDWPLAEQDLLSWTSQHQRLVKQLLATKFDDEQGKQIFAQLQENYQLFRNPVARQPLEQDLAWQQDMESNLAEWLYETQIAGAFELEMLNCKQKACEVMLDTTDARTAKALYFHLLEISQNKGLVAHNPSPIMLATQDGSQWNYLYFEYQ